MQLSDSPSPRTDLSDAGIPDLPLGLGLGLDLDAINFLLLKPLLLVLQHPLFCLFMVLHPLFLEGPAAWWRACVAAGPA